MALILAFVNKSNLAPVSDYSVEVLVGDGSVERSRTIAFGTVKGHRRDDGWEVLVQAFLDQHRAKGSRNADAELRDRIIAAVAAGE